MGDTLTAIIAIALAAVLMFLFPLMTMSDRADDVAQLAVETATTEFVDNIRTTGKITPDNYGKFIEAIGSTGNTYDLEIEVKVLDENPGRKETTSYGQIGENVYYAVYTSQIEEKIKNQENYNLKEGDVVTVSVKNTNKTLAQQLKNFFYTVTGNNAYTIASSHGGTVVATGK